MVLSEEDECTFTYSCGVKGHDVNFQYPQAATAWATTENWVTTGWQQFLDCSHCPTRLNSTQLVLNMFRTPRLAKNWRFSVELS